MKKNRPVGIKESSLPILFLSFGRKKAFYKSNHKPIGMVVFESALRFATWSFDDTTDTPPEQACPCSINFSLCEAITSAEANTKPDTILINAETYMMFNDKLYITQDLTIPKVGVG
jgi:hypothetical protein